MNHPRSGGRTLYPYWVALATVIASTALAPCAAMAQSQDNLQQARSEFSNALQTQGYPAFLAYVVGLGNDVAVAGGTMHLRDEIPIDLGVSGLSVPFDITFPTSRWAITLTPIVGRVTTDFETELDLDTSQLDISSHYRVLSVGLGFGPTYIRNAFKTSFLLQFAISHVKNTASFAGPEAEGFDALTRGIMFNFSNFNLGYGFSVPFTRRFITRWITLTPMLRYDARITRAFDGNEAVQHTGSLTHWSTMRLDMFGPAGKIKSWPLRWISNNAYRRNFGAIRTSLGLKDIYAWVLGFGLSTPGIPLITELRATGGMFVGRDLRGWTVSAAASF